MQINIIYEKKNIYRKVSKDNTYPIIPRKGDFVLIENDIGGYVVDIDFHYRADRNIAGNIYLKYVDIFIESKTEYKKEGSTNGQRNL